MRIQWQVGAVLAVGLGIFVALSTQQYSRLMSRQAEDLTLKNLRSEVVTTRALVEKMAKDFGDELSRRVSDQERRRERGDSSSALAGGPFELIALLDPPQGQGRWRARWTERSRGGLAGSWSGAAVEQVLGTLPIARVTSQNTVWYRGEDSSGRLFLALLAQLQGPTQTPIVAVGLLPVSSFVESLAALKLADREVILLDERGFALGYSEAAYVGARLDNHPVVAEILGRRDLRGEGAFLNLKSEPVLAAFERLDSANLYLALVTARSPSRLFFAEFLVAAFLWALVVLALYVGAFYVLKPWAAAAKQPALTQEPIEAAHPATAQEDTDPSASPAESSAEVKDLRQEVRRLEADRQQVFKQIGFGLSQALTGPIAAILGHAQLARSKVREEESVKSHFVVIEREARRARETIENLGRLTNAAEVEKRRIDLQEVVLSALASLRQQTSAQGIKVNKDLSRSVAIMAHAGQLQTAIEEVIKNAVEALAGAVNKEISVSLRVDKGEAILVIEDSGQGMSSEQLAHAFDAFYTTKPPEENAGLGLGVAKGLVKNFGGQIELSSVPGQGTRVQMKFKALGVAQVQVINDDRPSVPTPEVSETTTIKPNPLPKVVVRPVMPANSVTAEAPPLSLGEEEARLQPVAQEGALDLLKGKAVTGTQVDDLPAPPDLDEQTFLGDLPDLDNRVESGLGESQVSEGFKEGDPAIVIRPPKLRSGG